MTRVRQMVWLVEKQKMVQVHFTLDLEGMRTKYIKYMKNLHGILRGNKYKYFTIYWILH